MLKQTVSRLRFLLFSTLILSASCQQLNIVQELDSYKKSKEGQTGFRVLSTDPVSGTQNVGLSPIVSVVFSEPVNTSTVNANVTVRLGSCASTIVSAGYSSTSADFRTIVFNLTALANSTSYVICVEGGLTATNGETIGTKRYEAVFTTLGTGVPTITSITSSTTDGVYKAANLITIQMNVSEVVNVTGGTPSLILDSGANALYVSGTGTTTLVFEYNITVGNSSNDLNVTSINIPGGAFIQNASLNNLSLTLPAGNNLADLKNLQIDAVLPAPTSMNSPQTGNAQGPNAPITITLVYANETSVNGTGVTITVAPLTLNLACSPAGNQFNCTGNLPATGVGSGTLSTVQITAGTITDAAGNNGTATTVPGTIDIPYNVP